MSKRRFPRIVFFAFLLLLIVPELFLSNLGSFGNIEEIAQQVGLSVAAERVRLVILIFFNIISGTGALLALVALLRGVTLTSRHLGVVLTTVGLIGYGIYQFFSAWFQLDADFRGPIMIIGVTYTFFGILAWVLNR